MEPLIEYKGVTCVTEHGSRALEDVTFCLGPDEKVLLTSTDAAARNTFIRLSTGLSVPQKGCVEVFGQELAALDTAALNRLRSRMGVISPESVLISNLKVIENVALPVMYHTKASFDSVMEKASGLLDSVGYTEDPWALPGHLPLDLRKAVMVARALAMEPRIIITEDLAEGLTDKELADLTELIVGYHRKSGTALLVMCSHSGPEAAAMEPTRTLSIEGARLTEPLGR